MFRRFDLLLAMAFIIWLFPRGGISKKQIVFNSMKCTIKSKLISKVLCSVDTPFSLTIHVTIGEQESLSNVTALTGLKMWAYGREKGMHVKNLRVELCQLKKMVAKKSMLGIIYKSFRRSAANFPEKCPFERNTTYSLKRLRFDGVDMPQYVPEFNYTLSGRIYANKEVVIEVLATGDFLDIKMDP